MKQPYLTVSTGLSAKARFAKMWEESKRARMEQMIHNDSGRVRMGHEHIQQLRT